MAHGEVGGRKFVEITCDHDNRHMLVAYDFSHDGKRGVEFQFQNDAGAVDLIYADEVGMRELFNMLGVLLVK